MGEGFRAVEQPENPPFGFTASVDHVQAVVISKSEITSVQAGIMKSVAWLLYINV